MEKKDKKEKKAFKDTLFGKIVIKAGDIVTDVPKIMGQLSTGNYMGAVATLAGNLEGSKDPKAPKILNELILKMEQIKLELAKVELEEFRIGEENVTTRWTADMASDSWLSKNIRPMGMAWVLLLTTVLMIVTWSGVNTPLQVITMFGGLATTITGGYYVLRTVEKRNNNKYTQ